MITKKQNYNNVPVTYCKTCLSLHIKEVTIPNAKVKTADPTKVNYCVECSNTDLGHTHISEWEDMHKERYGQKFLTEK